MGVNRWLLSPRGWGRDGSHEQQIRENFGDLRPDYERLKLVFPGYILGEMKNGGETDNLPEV
jgi:hypothetical protein